jgi:hypothetical protein
MVTVLFIAACSLYASPPEAIGAVRVVRGDIALHSGDLIAPGREIATGPSGWVELELLRVGRVRLSASTRVGLLVVNGSDVIRLDSGRAWIEHSRSTGPLEVLTPNARAFVLGKSSVIVEHTRSAGTTVAVRAGSATMLGLAIDQSPITIGANQIETLGVDARSLAPARVGGSGLADLAQMESKAALGDLIGVKAFLLEHVAIAPVRGFAPRGVSDILRSQPEISGGDSGPAGAAIEGGLRPPPFFENEVPPRGPNVRVKVTFGE